MQRSIRRNSIRSRKLRSEATTEEEIKGALKGRKVLRRIRKSQEESGKPAGWKMTEGNIRDRSDGRISDGTSEDTTVQVVTDNHDAEKYTPESESTWGSAQKRCRERRKRTHGSQSRIRKTFREESFEIEAVEYPDGTSEDTTVQGSGNGKNAEEVYAGIQSD